MCLIFVGQGHSQKLFNLEHFLIYSFIDIPYYKLLIAIIILCDYNDRNHVIIYCDCGIISL